MFHCLSLFFYVLVLALSLTSAARDIATKAATIPRLETDPLTKLAELVVPYGYPLDVHNVETEDGFILTLLRIPHGRADVEAASSAKLRRSVGTAASRPVIFLQHGLLDSAAGFLVNGPGRSLAFLLADAGYDVWLGNVRGNTLSRSHAFLDASDARFWQWSYDEMAAYDLPAMMQYALRTSGAPSLRYVGHSQGTTVLLAALAGPTGEGRVPSQRASDSDAVAKGAPAVPAGVVERAVLLAPVAVAKHISSVPLLAMAAMGTDDMFTLMGLHEFLPSQELVAQLEGRLCVVQPYLCVSFLAALCGYNPSNLDITRLPLYLGYTPAGTSVQNMAHWAQAVRARAPNSMRCFDFGVNCASFSGRCNQRMYGTIEPPRYNLTAITTPLAVFTGTHDRLSTPLDLEYLRESLGPGVVKLSKNLEAYEHLDFIWGIDAKELLYDDVLRFLSGDDDDDDDDDDMGSTAANRGSSAAL
ncbi:hypothetical protein Vafri_3829 [Volvox africanus]|uniref:Partial AB-hydrolase lipase domain-containing protein n=2 Tax=Volvox africanus TaxID=51714 RepID=A0A8J4AT15_9CHLO|nr:hypothetical protein Vafri_3829 [Volvox africanus]